jgi:uncharacterized protein with FMN-binding domain
VKRTSRVLPIAVSAALALSPAAGIANAAVGAEQTLKGDAARKAAPARAYKRGRRFAGKPATMSFGPVQVTITVVGKHMKKVSASAPEDRPRSRAINQHAVPILVHEALHSQSVRGVHKVSGASLTSGAFLLSLANAMAKAGLPGA